MRPRNEILPTRHFFAAVEFLFQMLEAAKRLRELLLQLLDFGHNGFPVQEIISQPSHSLPDAYDHARCSSTTSPAVVGFGMG